MWSELLWQSTLKARWDIDEKWPVQFGCDVAAFGDDDSVIHGRKGLCGIHHESHNGWTGKQLAGRLKQLCNQHASKKQGEFAIPCLIDVGGGYGNAVVENADKYNFVAVNSSSVPRRGELSQPAFATVVFRAGGGQGGHDGPVSPL